MEVRISLTVPRGYINEFRGNGGLRGIESDKVHSLFYPSPEYLHLSKLNRSSMLINEKKTNLYHFLTTQDPGLVQVHTHQVLLVSSNCSIYCYIFRTSFPSLVELKSDKWLLRFQHPGEYRGLVSYHSLYDPLEHSGRTCVLYGERCLNISVVKPIFSVTTLPFPLSFIS